MMPPYTEQQMTVNVSISAVRVRVFGAWLRVFKAVPWLWKPIGEPVALGPLRRWVLSSIKVP